MDCLIDTKLGAIVTGDCCPSPEGNVTGGVVWFVAGEALFWLSGMLEKYGFMLQGQMSPCCWANT